MFRRESSGITLVEALITLSILLTLYLVSAPALSDNLDRQKSQSALRIIEQSIRTARSEALQRNGLVTLCRSTDGQTCGGDWGEGIIIFSDVDGDHVLDAEDQLIQHISMPELAGTIRWRAFRNRQYLQITPEGFTRYQNGNFTYCPFDADIRKAMQLVLSRTARVRYAKDSDGDGVVENSRGSPVACN